jgi:recombination protein RecT
MPVRPQEQLHEYREPVSTRPAATVLLLRDSPSGYEVLMTRRSMTASFAPGAFVFPGGALDADDGSQLAQQLSNTRATQHEEQKAFTVASIREAFEELGVLLAYKANGEMAGGAEIAQLSRERDANFLSDIQAAGFKLAVDKVYFLCHWITDRDLPKRFDARFFAARMPEGQLPVADEGEQFEPVWVSPNEALARHDRGEFSMIFPTIRTLRWMGRFSSIDHLLAACHGEKPLFISSPRAGLLKGEIERFSEHEAAYGELEMVVPDGQIKHTLDWNYTEPVALLRNVLRLTCPNPGMMTGAGTNTYIIVGRTSEASDAAISEYAVIDPGPTDRAHIERIAAVVGKKLKYILCTHAHLDHSPGAAYLKELTGAPILGRQWLPSTFGKPDYGDFLPEREIEHGERFVVGHTTLRAVHTPGHASNHLCFIMEEDGLLISGDHINNGSTVVINPPDGNMLAYINALDVLANEPVDYILPAHGWVLGPAKLAIAQLKGHRLGREAKVFKALQGRNHSTTKALLPLVYDDVRPELFPVAERSLIAHLEKLVEDGRVSLREEIYSLV